MCLTCLKYYFNFTDYRASRLPLDTDSMGYWTGKYHIFPFCYVILMSNNLQNNTY